MIKRLLFLLLTALSVSAQPRCIGSRGEGLGRILGGITGSTYAARRYSYKCYYREGPSFDFSYPGAPKYIYSHPTYVYSPTYAYQNIRYDIYPSYFFTR